MIRTGLVLAMMLAFPLAADAQSAREGTANEGPRCVDVAIDESEYDDYNEETSVWWRVVNRCDRPVNFNFVFNTIGYHQSSGLPYPWHHYRQDRWLAPGATTRPWSRWGRRYGDLRRDPTIYYCAEYQNSEYGRPDGEACPESALATRP